VVKRSFPFKELRRLLREELDRDEEALRLAEELLNAYEEGGTRRLRARIRELLLEVSERGAET